MTVDTVAALTTDEARRLTERIRVALDRVASSWADLGDRVAEAHERRADLALGYGSWEEYATAELSPSLGLAAEVRRELVGMLANAGMSQRAIAPVVGVTQQGVSKIARQVTTQLSPEPKTEYIDHVTGEIIATEPTVTAIGGEAAAVTVPPKTIGLDGKSYSRPAPKAEPDKPRRPAFPPQIQSAGWELDKITQRLARLSEDDRFNSHKAEVAPHLRSHLTSAIEVCQDLLNRISN